MWVLSLLGILFVGLFSCKTWVKEMENVGLWEGDIVLDPDEKESTFGQVNNAYASIKGGRWPNARVPYVITRSIGSRGRQVIQQAFDEYHKKTCLRFYPRNGESSYISFFAGGGCSSPVGYRRGRRNDISLGGGCQYLGTTLHEIGHSIGLYHEQSRPDRDKYVKILTWNIQRGMGYNFNKHSYATIDSLGTPYDFRSMMHYGSTAFGGGRRTIEAIDSRYQRMMGNRDGFSDIDIKQINLMYCGGTGPTPEPPTKLPTQPPGGCVDFDKRCEGWKGYCTTTNEKYKLIMDRKCCATCKGTVIPTGGPVTDSSPTPPPDVCIDIDKRCGFWASNGYCPQSKVHENNYREIMVKKCCRSCKDFAQCRDRNNRCQEWANRGECKVNPKYMHEWCRKGCKLCS